MERGDREKAKVVIRSMCQSLLVLVTWLMPAEESYIVGGSLPTMHF